MELAIQDNPRFQSAISGKTWLAIAIIATGSSMAAVIWNWWLVFLPLGFVAAMICILRPTWGLFLLVGALFFPYLVISNPQSYPGDLILVLVILGFWLYRARQGKMGFVRTPLDGWVMIWLAVLALSLVNAYDVQRGLINLLRHIQLFFLFYAVVGLAHHHISRRMIGLLIGITTILALFNIVPFLLSGGIARVYGVAKVSFNLILMVAIVYLAARFCFESHKWKAWLYAGLLFIAVLGQTANQSRAAFAVASVGVIIVLIAAWRWPNTDPTGLPKLRAKQLIAAGLVLTVLAVIVATPMLGTIMDRFRGVGNAGATLRYREFVWKTALVVFLDQPFLGIGLGQIQIWQHVIPSLRLQPLGPLTFGIGSHLSFLKYLAESGTLGAGILLILMAKIVRIGVRVIRRPKSLADAGHEIGISVAALMIVLQAFIEGGLFYAISGMITVLLWGMMINMYLRSPSETQ